MARIVGAVGHIVDDSRPDKFDMAEFGREQAERSSTLDHMFTLVSSDTLLGVPQLQTHLEALGVAKSMWPKRVKIIDALPRTQVGKIEKKAPRDDIARKPTS